VIASPIDYDHGCAPIGWCDHWRQSATLGYDHGHRNRDHSDHPLSMTMRMSFWRCCRLDIVITTSLKCSRHRRRWQTTRMTSVVGRPTLSSFAVCRHSRNPSYCMRPRDYDVHMSRRVCLGPLSVPASGYGYSCMTYVCPCNFVTFVPARVSRPPVTSSLSHGSGNIEIKEIQIQTFCDR